MSNRVQGTEVPCTTIANLTERSETLSPEATEGVIPAVAAATEGINSSLITHNS